MKKFEVSVIIPAHNSATTLKKVLASLEIQDYPVGEVLILDNNSSDNTAKIAEDYAEKSSFNVVVIKHKKDMGLAYSYNDALLRVKTPLAITLQSDCVINKKDGVSCLVRPFEKEGQVVATCAFQKTPQKIWDNYSFWQKCLFSRHVGKILSGRNGRFCCFKVETLKKVGFFDAKHYRTAGEDGDLLAKIARYGKILDVDTVVDHLHSINPNFSLSDYFYKENQLAEGVGACYGNNYKIVKFRNFATPFIRPILFLGLLIPIANLAVLAITFFFCFWLTKEVFIREIRNPRVLVLPIVNFILLFSYSFYFLKGVLTKRQIL